MGKTKETVDVRRSSADNRLSIRAAVQPAWKPVFVLILIMLSFVLLQYFLPLSTTIKIGGDEGFELSKALLCLKGHKLYSEVWNDQPPLHTFLITETLKHITSSILGPRLVTTAFTLLLLTAVFLIILRINGLAVAALTTGLLIASPGFLALGSSCMLEIPALGTTVAAVWLLLTIQPKKWPVAEVLSGLLFGGGCQMKLISVILLPLIPMILWLKQGGLSKLKLARSLLIFAVSLVISFVAIDYLVDGGAYLAHFKQSWISHFAATKSVEYGSPADHPFDWRILFRNWDATLPAVLGIVICWRQFKKEPVLILPVVWMVMILAIFVTHKPWWSYYYVHISVPLCWCAAIGIKEVQQHAGMRKGRNALALLVLYALCVLPWMTARLYLQITAIRNSPQTYSELALKQIERFKPFTDWMYADEPVYSFQAGIPLPPDLAVVMLKRLWSGDMTNDKITAELTDIKPGIILLANDTLERPFKNLLTAEYRMVYMDGELRLYIHQSIVHKPPPE